MVVVAAAAALLRRAALGAAGRGDDSVAASLRGVVLGVVRGVVRGLMPDCTEDRGVDDVSVEGESSARGDGNAPVSSASSRKINVISESTALHCTVTTNTNDRMSAANHEEHSTYIVAMIVWWGWRDRW